MLFVVMNPTVHAVNGGERPMHAVNGDKWRWQTLTLTLTLPLIAMLSPSSTVSLPLT